MAGQVYGKKHIGCTHQHGNPVPMELQSLQLEKPRVSNGFILVSANGGLNQQRVAVCNTYAVASLLNEPWSFLPFCTVTSGRIQVGQHRKGESKGQPSSHMG